MLGNHRYQLIIHSHVRRNSCSLAFELICTQFKDCLWKLRGTVPWEQKGERGYEGWALGTEARDRDSLLPWELWAGESLGDIWSTRRQPGSRSAGRCWVEAKGKLGKEELEGKMDGFQWAVSARLQISMGENNHRKFTFNGQLYTVNPLLQGL